MSINYSLALLLPCSFHDEPYLQRPHTPTIWILHDFNYLISKRENLKTCLTNHKGSISHHIMPVVINSLGGGDTHTDFKNNKSNFKKPGAPAKGRRAPGSTKTNIL